MHAARRLGGPGVIGGIRAGATGPSLYGGRGNVSMVATMFTERPNYGFATLREPYVKLDTGNSMQENLMQR